MDCCGATPEIEAVVLTVWAAFGIGLTTSLGHCIGMCGPLVGAYALAQGHADKRVANLAPGLLIYHLGRINSYAVIGLLFGLAGSAAQAAGPSAAVRGALFGFAGLLMVVLAMGLAGWLPTTRLIESTAVGRLVAGRFVELAGTRHTGGRYLLGVANGFLPCGPVYAVAIAALTAPTPLHGAAIMAMFGLGTVPVMTAVGLGAGRLSPTVQRRFNLVATLLVLIVGLGFLMRAAKMFGLIDGIKWGFIPIW